MVTYITGCDWLTENHVCFVTSRTLYKHKLLHQSWVQLSFPQQQESTNQNHKTKPRDIVGNKFSKHEDRKSNYIVQLFVSEDDSDLDVPYENQATENIKERLMFSREKMKDEFFYVSSLTLFNICQRDVSLYRSIREEASPIVVTHIKQVSVASRKNYAKSVSISQINCPFIIDIPEDEINNKLERFFTKPRLLQKDEVFVVKIPANDFMHNRFDKDLLFRVDGIEYPDDSDSRTHNAVYVNKELATLYQSGSRNHYFPSCSCLYRKNYAIKKFLNKIDLQKLFANPILTIENVLKIITTCKTDLSDTLTLLDSAKGMGKSFMLRHVCFKYCLHYFEVNCFDLIGDSLSACEKRIAKVLDTCKNISPCLLHLKNVHVLCRDKEGLNEERRITNFFITALKDIYTKFPIIIVASTNQVRQLTQRFHSSFFYHIKLEPPNIEERIMIIKLITGISFSEQVISNMSKKTAGFVFSDFLALLRNIENDNLEEFLSLRDDPNATARIEKHIESIRKLKAGKNSDTGKIPNVKWEDVGGLEGVKNDVFDTIDLPLRYPQMFKQDFKRSGLLLYGNPGCGKTLLAKAIATEFSLNFYSVKGPELISMYVGQSEENIRNVFDKARGMAPCVIFFDELDSLAPNRGRNGDSGGVMDRIVSQLLAELDGIHDNTDLFIIGATNRPDLLDAALLRPGRFDKLIYVGLPKGAGERLKILEAVCRKLTLASDVSLIDIEKFCPSYMTGADFSALASDAVMNCYRRLIISHETSNIELSTGNVVIHREGFLLAIDAFVPSLSETELQRYDDIRRNIESQSSN